ncbi:hypothetical protein [Campylobacter pinnipediorum]|nr:hypothetical protein [Campylobacter pinnipediorum]
MMSFFNGWQEFATEGASVSFYKKDDFIGFDSRKCMPPEPMVNAMVALNLVKDKNTKIIMINHKFPVGLIPKIEDKFDIEREDLENGEVKLIFTLKQNASLPNFETKQICHG